MYSSVRAPRRSNGTPSASNSSSSHPIPTPRRSRPLLITSSVAACLAMTTGLRRARIRIPVPSLMVDVATVPGWFTVYPRRSVALGPTSTNWRDSIKGPQRGRLGRSPGIRAGPWPHRCQSDRSVRTAAGACQSRSDLGGRSRIVLIAWPRITFGTSTSALSFDQRPLEWVVSVNR